MGAAMRQEAACASETGKGVSGGRLSSLTGVAETYGYPHRISTEPSSGSCQETTKFKRDGFFAKLADPVLAGFVSGSVSAEEARGHMKAEEQKWIRKARKYALYENLPYRVK